MLVSIINIADCFLVNTNGCDVSFTVQNIFRGSFLDYLKKNIERCTILLYILSVFLNYVIVSQCLKAYSVKHILFFSFFTSFFWKFIINQIGVVNFGFFFTWNFGRSKVQVKKFNVIGCTIGLWNCYVRGKMEWYLNKPTAHDLFLCSVLHRYFLMNHQWMI